jgi:hypothetical protein
MDFFLTFSANFEPVRIFYFGFMVTFSITNLLKVLLFDF